MVAGRCGRDAAAPTGAVCFPASGFRLAGLAGGKPVP